MLTVWLTARIDDFSALINAGSEIFKCEYVQNASLICGLSLFFFSAFLSPLKVRTHTLIVNRLFVSPNYILILGFILFFNYNVSS